MTNVQLRADTHTHTQFKPTHTHIYGRTLDRLWDVLSSPFLESWSSWSEWSHCDSNGAQMRVRHCDVLFPTGNQCLGNNSETRPCSPDSNFIPGDFTHTHTHTHTHTVASSLRESVRHSFAWLNTQLWAHTHTFCATCHHMPTAVIQFISKNPAIMKYVIDPSEELLAGQRSGSASGQRLWGWFGLVSSWRTPECGRWLHGGVNPVATLKGCSPYSFQQPRCYISFIMSLGVLSGHAKSTYSSSFTFPFFSFQKLDGNREMAPVCCFLYPVI